MRSSIEGDSSTSRRPGYSSKRMPEAHSLLSAGGALRGACLGGASLRRRAARPLDLAATPRECGCPWPCCSTGKWQPGSPASSSRPEPWDRHDRPRWPRRRSTRRSSGPGSGQRPAATDGSGAVWGRLPPGPSEAWGLGKARVAWRWQTGIPTAHKDQPRPRAGVTVHGG